MSLSVFLLPPQGKTIDKFNCKTTYKVEIPHTQIYLTHGKQILERYIMIRHQTYLMINPSIYSQLNTKKRVKLSKYLSIFASKRLAKMTLCHFPSS